MPHAENQSYLVQSGPAHPRGRSTIAVLAACILLVLATASEQAAATTVNASLGVIVLNADDGVRHELEIWDASLLEKYRPGDWQLGPHLPDLEAQLTAGPSQQLDATATVLEKDLEDTDTDTLIDNVADDLTSLATVAALTPDQELDIELARNALDRASEAYGEFQNLKKTVSDERIELVIDVADGKLTRLQANLQWRAWVDTIKPDIERLDTQINNALTAFQSSWDHFERSEPQGEALAAWFSQIMPKKRRLDARIAHFLRTGLKIGPLLLAISLYFQAEAIASTVHAFSDHSIFIHDRTGQPIEAPWPCRDEVRTFGGAVIPNTVSCPVWDLVGVGNQMNIVGGSQKDVIELHLTEERNNLDNVEVQGQGGNDEIYGSYLDEYFYGGPGNDTIKGKGGDDTIYGEDTNPFNDTLPDDDRLAGGAGSDTISGQQGNDMILGGADDDAYFWRTALLGGAGDDVLVGGSGQDDMAGGTGRDTIFAREQDFPDWKGGPIPDPTIDHFDCEADDYYRTSGLEELGDCYRELSHAPTFDELLQARPRPDGTWDWFDWG